MSFYFEDFFSYLPGSKIYSALVPLCKFIFVQPKPGSKKVSVDELRKKEKECRRLKHELSTEKEKFNEMVGKYQADLQTLQVRTSVHDPRAFYTYPDTASEKYRYGSGCIWKVAHNFTNIKSFIKLKAGYLSNPKAHYRISCEAGYRISGVIVCTKFEDLLKHMYIKFIFQT
jgi:hypothetical protein